MAHGRSQVGRSDRRAFRPTLDGTLESRALLSTLSARVQTAAGGQAVVVTEIDGSRYFVSVLNGGTVRGTSASNGRVNLIVTGSTVDTLLEINQITPILPLSKGAHTYNPAFGRNTPLNVASITVTSGLIGSIEGYRDTILSGPVVVGGTSRVDRIAFESIAPGGSISVGGDLNTLDVLNDANFSNSAGLFVARDLNWFEVGGNLTFQNGANMVVGRDLGLVGQAAKGTGLPGQGLYVNGNLTVAPGVDAAIVRRLAGGFIINGNFGGVSRFFIDGEPLATYFGQVNGVGFVFNGTLTA